LYHITELPDGGDTDRSAKVVVPEPQYVWGENPVGEAGRGFTVKDILPDNKVEQLVRGTFSALTFIVVPAIKRPVVRLTSAPVPAALKPKTVVPSLSTGV
jgi:hypothetical protein